MGGEPGYTQCAGTVRDRTRCTLQFVTEAVFGSALGLPPSNAAPYESRPCRVNVMSSETEALTHITDFLLNQNLC